MEKNRQVETLRRRAEGGDPWAMVLLGLFLRDTTHEEKEAVGWFRRAAMKGNARGQFELGTCLLGGRGCKKHVGDAMRWLEAGAKQGNVGAQVLLGETYLEGKDVKQDLRRSAEWMRQAAEQGDAKAMEVIGVCYLEGLGVVRDEECALEWLRKAMNAGRQRAELRVGRMLHARRSAEAVGVLERVAARGDAEAMARLAEIHLNGQGVDRNEEVGLWWAQQAAERGHEQAQAFLDRRYRAVADHILMSPETGETPDGRWWGARGSVWGYVGFGLVVCLLCVAIAIWGLSGDGRG